MAITVQGSTEFYDAFVQNVGDEEIHYDYPVTTDGTQLNLHPKSDLHRSLVPKLLQRGQASRRAMSSRYPEWRKLDHNCNSYIEKTDEERLTKAKNPDKPIRVIMPVSYAIRETLLTYFTAALLGDEIYFPYEGVGPEDVVGAILLQHCVQQQVLRSQIELALHTQWSDSLTYGIGITAPRWGVEYGQRTHWKPEGYYNFFGRFVETGVSQQVENELLWEGNEVENIDPYLYLPDPSVSAHRIQKGEYVGWMALENRLDLQSRENTGTEGLFNCKYLRHTSGTSSLANTEHGRGEKHGTDIYENRDGGSGPSATKNPVWLMYMYIKLVPKEWGLGESEQVEKWMFALANDSIIVRAQPLNLDHNLFPICVCAPDFDGYSIAPTSKLETIYGLQEYIDWLISTHILNQRKTVNNTVIADPYIINIPTLKKAMGSPGGIVLTRRASWGKGVKDGVMQLATSDITRANISDAAYIIKIMEKVTSAAGFLQGAFDDAAPERRTAAEYQGTANSAEGRLARMVRNIHTMSMRPLGMMMASHTIQLMSKQAYAKLSGDWPRILAEEYGINVKDGRATINPQDLDINYDISPVDGRVASHGNMQNAMNLYGLIAGNPVLSSRIDIVRFAGSLARRMGEKNFNNFVIKPELVPDEVARQKFARGETTPLSQVGAAA